MSRFALVRLSIRVLDILIFCCLLAVIVLVTVPYGTVDPWWESMFECGVFALTAIWILEGFLRGSWQLKRILVLLPMILITAYVFLQAAHLPFLVKSTDGPIARHSLSIDEYQTHLTAVKTLALTLFCVLLLQHVTTHGRLKWLVRTVIGLGLAAAIFGIMRQLLQAPTATTGFALAYLYPGVGYGQFLSANVFAFLVEMAFALLLGLLLGRGIVRHHILFYLVVGLLIWTALVLANSRGGLAGSFCAAIFLLLVALREFSARGYATNREGEHRFMTFLRTSRLVRVFAGVVIMATMIVAVLWMGGERLASKIGNQESVNEKNYGTTRKEIWHSSWQLIKQNPGTGVGFGAYYLAIPQFEVGYGGIKLEQAHNDYLDLTASGGVVAVFLAALLVGVVIWRGTLSLKSHDPYRRAAALGALAGLLSVAVHNVVDFGLQITGIAVVALALVVISIAEVPKPLKNK